MLCASITSDVIAAISGDLIHESATAQSQVHSDPADPPAPYD
jgi:hypothetical protein